MALATPNQLYRLNREGRLVLVPVGTEVVRMDHVAADLAIKESLGGSVEAAREKHSQ